MNDTGDRWGFALGRQRRIHRLKTWPEYFNAVLSGLKTFELRWNDRGFLVDDLLVLEEWDPASRAYTGRTLDRRVSYTISDPAFGLPAGWVAMGLAPTEPQLRVLTCVYCGHEYPQNTPTWGTQVLTQHVKVCREHPMRQLELVNAQLRTALVGLVGVDTRDELAAMEAFLRLTPAPAEDKAHTIDAIHALRDTLLEVSP